MAQSSKVILMTIILGLLKQISSKCMSHDEMLVYHWISVEFNWPNDTMKQEYIDSGKYIPENNAINGIKLYNDDVYLTIPRLKDGVAASLVKVDKSQVNEESPKLNAYPSWEMHTQGDCNKLQLVQSMEIDPETGLMWILDTAYVPRSPTEVAEYCSPKIVIWDINLNIEVDRYVFPESVVLQRFYLNDLVLDYGSENEVRYVYISDTLGWKMVVYDHKEKRSYSFLHSSFERDPAYASILINGQSTMAPLGVNGIAMSSDFNEVYYCPLASQTLYSVPTSALRNNNSNINVAVKTLGSKDIQSDGLYYGKGRYLYYSTLGQNGVYRWDIVKNNKEVLVQNSAIEWVDSLGMDENGYLWFTSNNLHTFFGNSTSPGKTNYYVWKVYVGEKGYLAAPKGSPRHTCSASTSTGTHPANIANKWVSLEYEWPTCEQRKEAVNSNKFIFENNEISGIRVHGGKIYVTIPRTKDGVVATLGILNDHFIKPFPSAAMNTFGDCNALQLVQSIEIDMNTGHMWILDTAIAHSCRPKLVVYDLYKDSEAFRYEFPESVLDQEYFLEDLVLDYVSDTAAFAYISNSLGHSLIIFDIKNRTARHITHPSMNFEKQYENITIAGITHGPYRKGIKGIAISPNFQYVYYTPLAGRKLYQIKTSVLRNESSSSTDIENSVQMVGNKAFSSTGLYSSKTGLYLTDLSSGSVYKWHFSTSGTFTPNLTPNQTLVTKNCLSQWLESPFVDEKGLLWFTSRNVQAFLGNSTTTGTFNFFTWKSNVGDKSYLSGLVKKSTSTGTSLSNTSFIGVLIVCLPLLFYSRIF
ncbi:uncharacterized protein LOC133194188 [Saccostrea echinata]|uniref:uncharacterized protein LOC133194188 n=1 Tax=Saccostrea echinata TaxID=191078 RepID=UPI002A822234|nr:uncharacterized protein LOC133194188 [Saccostrea echinata]